MNKISESVAGVLKQCRIEEDKVFLPSNLDKKLYTEVNKHLENSGGKWNRKLKCHIFPKGTSKLKEGIDFGATVNEQQVYQSFFTPSWLAARVVEIANVSGQIVLEPSAGTGNLVKECIVAGAKSIDCKELNPEFCKELRKISMNGGLGVGVENFDFLNVHPQLSYTRVVMNPPFTKNQWLKHLLHAYNFLVPGSKLVAILPDSRTNAKLVDFLQGKDYVIHDVEAGAFKEEGTMVKTMILEINR